MLSDTKNNNLRLSEGKTSIFNLLVRVAPKGYVALIAPVPRQPLSLTTQTIPKVFVGMNHLHTKTCKYRAQV